MSKLRIGLLSAARITDKAIIHPASVVSGAKLVCMAARNRQKAEAKAAEWGVGRVHHDYDAVINDPDIDLVYNPLPINLHAEWTIKALRAGKHVLCEKPFAMNAFEAKAVIAATQETGKRVIEAFHYRYHPAFEHCQDWVRSGRIGDIERIEAVFNVSIPYSADEIRHRIDTGGGAMMDLGCYPLSWALMLMDGQPDAVEASATLNQGGVDESLSAELRFPGGAIASLRASMAAETPFKAALHILGSDGEIMFQNPLAPHEGGRLNLQANGQTETANITGITTYTWQLEALVRAIKSGQPMPTEGDMILRQQETLDAVYEAAGLRDLRYL